MAITLSGDGIARANLAADVIDSTKLADDAVNSEHYVDASIDNAHLADDAVGVAELSATGTASSSTYLRGDNSWATVSTPITALNNATADELVTVGSTTTELDAESGLTFNGTVLHTNAGTSGASTHSASRIRIEDDTHCGLEITTPNTSEQYIMFSDPQGQAGEIKFAHSTNLMNFQSNGSFAFKKSATTHMNITTDGEVTMPLQPCFSVHMGSNQTGTSAGIYQTLLLDSESYDIGSNFNTSTNTFTAPVTGKYLISITWGMKDWNNAGGEFILNVTTSNRSYKHRYGMDALTTDAEWWYTTITHVCDMDANDTCYFRMKQQTQSGFGTEYYGGASECRATGILVA